MPQIDFQPLDKTAGNDAVTLQAQPVKQTTSGIDFQPSDNGAEKLTPALKINQPVNSSAPKSAPTGPTFSAAPRSVFQNIKDAFVGPGTTYGAAQSRRSGGPQENQFEKPLIDFQAITKGLKPPQQFGKAVLGGIEGAETFLSGLDDAPERRTVRRDGRDTEGRAGRFSACRARILLLDAEAGFRTGSAVRGKGQG